jgi:hypothetical protein
MMILTDMILSIPFAYLAYFAVNPCSLSTRSDPANRTTK